MSENYFAELYAINVNKYVEKKNGLSYVSWPFAWGEVKKLHPDATYTIYENADGLFYHTDGRTCWVKTGVTVNGIEHIEYLPVMDFKNRSIPVDQITSFDVNKAIQRSLTKAVAFTSTPGRIFRRAKRRKRRPFPHRSAQTAAECSTLSRSATAQCGAYPIWRNTPVADSTAASVQTA